MVIAANGVGGVEKRMSELWLHLAPRNPHLRMLVRESTFKELCRRPDLKALEDYRDRIETVDVESSSYPSTIRAFAPQLWRLPRRSVVHHLLQMPPLLHRLRGHRLLLSYVGTTLAKRSEKLNDWLVTTWSTRAADLIDVLNPEIFVEMSASTTLASKLRLTAGGTIVDGATFRPSSKSEQIVFMGRIESYKNALAFVDALPEICGRRSARGRPVAIRIFGRPGDQAEAVRARLASAQYRDLDIEWSSTDRPSEALAPAKIFMSLQVPSNYPSKALSEAMAAGCIPIITDSGESRRMADSDLARYIPERFTSAELADAVDDILDLEDTAFAARSEAVRRQALERFRIEPQAAYFEALYRELSQ